MPPDSEASATPAPAVDSQYANIDSADSTFENEVQSLTTSIAPSVVAYRYENGRRYHAYKERSYVFPNDEKEKARLDIMHKVVELTMNGRIYTAPIVNPRRVLDIGTGTGIWAMEFADKHPSADVLGNDLSPIQPLWIPPNVHFEVDDVEAEWAYSQRFDYIHCRSMTGAIYDWPRLVKQTFENLKPNGWAEYVEWDVTITSPDNSLPHDGAMARSNREFMRSLRDKGGMDPKPGASLKRWFADAGFTDVRCTRHAVPIGTWPADRRLKEVGAWNYLQMTDGLEGLMYRVFTSLLDYSKDQVDVMAAQWRNEVKDPRIHPMMVLYICIGRKPEELSESEE